MSDQLDKKETIISQSSIKSESFNIKSFGKDVLTYGFGQFALLVFGFIQMLILPKYLSVQEYGYWQLFLLYGSYVGILHFGFIDGILVRWAGKKLDDIKDEVGLSLKFLLIEEILVIVPLLIVIYFLDVSFSFILVAVLIYAFFTNIVTFFMFTAQAVKKFKLLTIMNIIKASVFLFLILILVLDLGKNRYYYVIAAQIISLVVALILYLFYFRGNLVTSTNKDITSLFRYGKKNVSIGIFVLLGNFSVVLFLTIDRLIVNTHFTISDFAIYAFGLTIAGIIYTFVGAVSQVLFPYLSGMHDESKNQLHTYFRPALILSWAAILPLYFPFTHFIEYYLPRYVSSLPIMQILLGTVGFGALIKILHVNYYKTYGRQKQYFLIAISMLGVAFLLNIGAVMFIGTLKSIAGATLVSFALWYLINEITLKKILQQRWMQIFKSTSVIGLYLLLFFCIPFYTQSYLYQILGYIFAYLLISYVFFRTFMMNVLKRVTSFF